MRFHHAIIAAAGLCFLMPSGGHALDFSCDGRLTSSERTICGSDELRRLDEHLARVYGRLWDAYGDRADAERRRLELRDEQRTFLSGRDACGPSARCIARAYRGQIAMLSDRSRVAGLR
ncbi:MAG: lysozyme inhibitor LprI family protein [Phycisphaerae bacterium]